MEQWRITKHIYLHLDSQLYPAPPWVSTSLLLRMPFTPQFLLCVNRGRLQAETRCTTNATHSLRCAQLLRMQGMQHTTHREHRNDIRDAITSCSPFIKQCGKCNDGNVVFSLPSVLHCDSQGESKFLLFCQRCNVCTELGRTVVDLVGTSCNSDRYSFRSLRSIRWRFLMGHMISYKFWALLRNEYLNMASVIFHLIT